MAAADSKSRPDRAASIAWSPRPIRWWHYLATLAIVLIATLPFLNKAFHIDDILYLHGAYQVLRGQDAFHGEVLWDAPDGQPASLFEIDHNPPLWKYVLAGTIRWMAPDRAEWKLHLVESAFVWLAGFGLLQLGRRFSPFPVWSTAMILWSPFFLPGQNLMLEGPLLCFWIWSVELLCRAWETDRIRWAWGAGLLAAAAVMTKYTGGLLLPLTVVGAVIAGKPRSLVAIVPPIVLLGAYLAHNHFLYAQSHIASHGIFYQRNEWPARLLSELRIVGGLTVLTPIFIGVVIRQLRWGWMLVGLSLTLGCVFAWLDLSLLLERTAKEGWTPIFFQRVHYLLFFVNGFMSMTLLAVTILINRRDNDLSLRPRRLLECWIILLLVFNITSVPFQAVRHLLMMFVPLVWLASLWLQTLPVGTSRALTRVLLLLSTLLGFSIAAADYELAGTYRRLARTSVRSFVASGRRVWFTGNWGFVYYASQEGALPIVEKPGRFGMPSFQARDIVVNPRIISFHAFPPTGFSPVRAFEHEQPPAKNFLRTIAPAVNYYGTYTDLLPWVLFVLPPDEDEKEAYFQLAPLDDVIYFEILPGSGATPR